ncbi:MAG: hypothetical protein IPK83_01500 [Planctomycetes bacterium]|nr:hypothetical protein [Planctomycetota bacterium]
MRLAKGMALAAALAMVSASSAMAGFTVTPGGTQNSNANVASGAATAGALNSTFTYNHANPDFVPGIVVIEGDLTDGGASGNWANDARIEICNPTVCVVTGGLTATQGYTGYDSRWSREHQFQWPVDWNLNWYLDF